jgi:hypothetical protein
MQTEPPKAEPPKRKRRWFQFSLRTPLVFTAIYESTKSVVGCEAPWDNYNMMPRSLLPNGRAVGSGSGGQFHQKLFPRGSELCGADQRIAE